MTDIPLSADQIYGIIITALSIVSGTSFWQLVKRYVHEGRIVVDHIASAVDIVDTAVQSPTVSEADFLKIWNSFKAIKSLNP